MTSVEGDGGQDNHFNDRNHDPLGAELQVGLDQAEVGVDGGPGSNKCPHHGLHVYHSHLCRQPAWSACQTAFTANYYSDILHGMTAAHFVVQQLQMEFRLHRFMLEIRPKRGGRGWGGGWRGVRGQGK